MYALKERKVVNFVKDEGYRVRAKCDLLFHLPPLPIEERWQIASSSEHCCPPRRDNNKLPWPRKVLGLDGCFFKGCTNGELSLGRDANNRCLCFGLQKETKESWDWSAHFRFTSCGWGRNHYLPGRDFQKLLRSGHLDDRNCARHVYANWRKKFKKKDFQKKWWRVAKSSCTLFNHNKALLAQHTASRALMNSAPEDY
ncbi:LOW QUALITY PROTEIN: hypothetical protein U9M48_014304 [Paspalum notatum var. saurae]|uniref:Uncharacterized protein n=1 Tax=Paspalum notatum var. saurae TaxID=547442 RepID=A0AAQ3T2E1_PASNO